MKFYRFILFAAFALGLNSCSIRLSDDQHWRLLDAWIDTTGRITDDPYLFSLKHVNKSLRILIKRNSENKESFTTYIANYDTIEKLISRIDAQANISTEIFVHGRWLPLQSHGNVSCGNSFWNMKLKSGEYIRFETQKPKPGWIPVLYKIKSESMLSYSVDDSIYSDSIYSTPRIIFLNPSEIAEAKKPFPTPLDFFFYPGLKKPIPHNLKLTWCDKITGSTLTKDEIVNNDSLMIGHVKNYKKLGTRFRIKEFAALIIYKDTTLRPYFEAVSGNKISQSFKKRMASLRSGDVILFQEIDVEWKDKVFNLPGAKYLVKT